jgi:heptosyltransferase II
VRLLVRATNWLGDAVMSIPALREIRRARPEAEIVVLARPWVADLYAREDFADRILVYDRNGAHKGLRGKGRLAAEIARERFDSAVLLQNAFDAALLAWIGRVPERVGYARDGRGPLLTTAVAPPKPGEIPAHQRFYYLELLRRAGWIAELPECADIRLHGVTQAAESGRALWRAKGLSEGPWIGVSPGAAYGGAKRWIPAYFAEAARTLAAEMGARVAVFGATGEAELCRAIAAETGPEAVSMAGETTLAEYIDLVAACRLYLTNDSGPMHVAAALGVPTVAIFGATDHVATGPSASWARVVRRDLDCTPCLLRECPLAEHRCMLAVTPETVVAEARGLLGG